MRVSPVRLLLVVLPLNLAAAQAKVVWGPAPAVFPAGAKMAVLQGNPSKTELFTVRLDLPDGYTISPHWHPTDESITVISGSFLVGMGDKADFSNAMSLKAADFATAGAHMNHFAR